MKEKINTVFENQFAITKSVLCLTAKQLELTAAEKSILVHLTHHLGQHDEFGDRFVTFVGQGTLANLVGSSRNTVNKTLKKCGELGYISSVMQFNNSKIYTFLGLPLIDEVKTTRFKLRPMKKPSNGVDINSRGEVESVFNPNSEIRQKQEAEKHKAKIELMNVETNDHQSKVGKDRGGSRSVTEAIGQGDGFVHNVDNQVESSGNINHERSHFDEQQLGGYYNESQLYEDEEAPY